MTIIIIGLCALGAWEAYVYYINRYAEDILLSVMAFGFAMFLGALWMSGVTV